MLIQAISYGEVKEKPLAFTYSGDFTDNRVDGMGDVTLNTSGKLTVLSGKATVSVYILAAGGGGAYTVDYMGGASGGGGGNQTVTVELAPGNYDIVIGTGGTTMTSGGHVRTAPSGGDTIAFGHTSTGGKGGTVNYSTYTAGDGGSPNGGKGKTGTYNGNRNVAGGSPNGGGFTTGTSTSDRSPKNVTNGGNGLVRITFS